MPNFVRLVHFMTLKTGFFLIHKPQSPFSFVPRSVYLLLLLYYAVLDVLIIGKTCLSYVK